MDTLLLIARLALAAVFAVAGVAKLMDLAGSRKAVADFGVPERLAPAAGLALPLAELGIALLLLPTATARWGALGALILLLAFIAAIGASLARGRAPDCHCFGQLHSEPAGPSTLVRNGILAAVAAFVLVAGWSDSGASLADPFGDLSAFDATLLVGELLLLGVVALLGWAVVQLMSQNGRLLTRLDEIEAGRAGEPSAAAPAAGPAQTATRPTGQPVGTTAPDFSLPDQIGTTVTLENLRPAGSRLLLLFTDPGCGPCRQVLQHVRQWRQAARASDPLQIEVISQGDRMANVARVHEYGLDRVLLQQGREVAQAYAVGGTPAGVLIERDGTIGAPLAGGFEAIRDLVASLTGTGAAPAPAPAPAPPKPALTGTAPDFQLPSLDGSEVSLERLRARGLPVVLQFTDPRCGPCYELLPDLGGWQRVYGDQLTFALVSGGSPDTNRSMTAEYGIPADSVLLQAEREIAEDYNILQMPAAIVIGADGEIQQEVTYGAQMVRKLVADTLGLALPERPTSQVKAATVGEPAPVFRRPDLDGIPRQVGGQTGEPTIVLFWNPGCPHCERLLPEVKAWEAQPDAPNLVVVSRGPVGLNQEMGLRSTIVLDDDRAISQAYGSSGTPGAIAIDSLGMIASSVGRGATGVRALVTEHSTVSAGATDTQEGHGNG